MKSSPAWLVAAGLVAIAIVIAGGLAIRPGAHPRELRAERSTSNTGPPTFTRDVAPILLAKCAVCHRPGQSGPFSLLAYKDATKHAKDIVEVTARRFMPPWLPEPGYVELLGDRSLSDAQIATIRRWVEGGEIEGDRQDLPPVPTWPEGWQLGPPDLVLEMPETFTLKASGADLYRNFVLPPNLDRTRWIRAADFHPGNAKVVHHAVVLLDRTGSARYRDRLDPGPGFDGEMVSEAEMPEGQWLAWVPGKRQLGVERFPWRLDKGTDLVLQLHLQTTGKPEPVRSKLALYFADQPPATSPFLIPVSSHLIDIAPGTRDFLVRRTLALPASVRVLGVWPHAHYLAKEMRGFATLPDGTTRWLLKIKDWDFNWQDEYHYVEPIELPKGSVVTIEYTYDNSEDNPHNPSHPPGRVRFGYSSRNEMASLHLHVTPQDPGELERLRRQIAALNLRQAVADFEELRRRDPVDVPTLAMLAETYALAGQTDQAIEAYRKAVQLDSTTSQMRVDLASLLLDRGAEPEAIQLLQKALSIDPKLATAHVSLGNVLRARGKIEQAIAHYEKALESGTLSAEVHNNLGNAYTAVGKSKEAAAQYEQALELWPNYPAAHYNLAGLLAAAGRLEGAEHHYRWAIDIKPSFAEAQNNLAIMLVQQGKTDEAIAHLRKALEASPSFDEARDNLTRALGRGGKLGIRVKDDPRGLRVLAVEPETAAAKGGIEPDDLITSIQGSASTQPALGRAVEWAKTTGRPIELAIERGDVTRSVRLSIGPPPADAPAP